MESHYIQVITCLSSLIFCSQEQDFRRLILRYSLAGHVTSLTKELYRCRGSFEFEKRLSISMRRSHSSHPMGSPQVCCDLVISSC